MMVHKPRLHLEQLEERTVPSTTLGSGPTETHHHEPPAAAPAAAAAATASEGTPWPDASHITISFAPDGTPIAAHQSDLFHTLNAQEPTATWEGQILKAAWTWAKVANIDFSVVADGGEPFGAPGMTQGDSRFGDIRIGAQNMAPSSLASAVAPDPAISGTWTGDILLNDTKNFTLPSSNLYSVMLHEFGHSLGLPDSNDPNSVMYKDATTPRHELAPSDIQAIQALYGARPTAPSPNNSLQTAIPFGGSSNSGSGSEDGSVPTLGFGNIANPTDANFFQLTVNSDYQGPMTIRLVTAGISFLYPQLTIYDAGGNIVGQAQPTTLAGGLVTIRLPQVNPGDVYYLGVQAAPGVHAHFGHYGMAAIFNAVNTVPLPTIDQVLQGPYQSLPESELQQLMTEPQDVLFNDSGGLNSTPATALALQSDPALPPGTYYQTLGSLTDTEDTMYYSVAAPVPAGGAPVVMTVSVQSSALNTLNPTLTLLDANLNPLSYQVIAHDTGTYTIQAAGLVAGANYYIELSLPDDSTPVSGNFSLSADFREGTNLVQDFSSGTITAQDPQPTAALYAATTQLFNFLLNPTGPSSVNGTTVQMTILDQNGNTVFQLQAPVGTPMSNCIFLLPGAYTIVFSAIPPNGAPLAGPVSFTLQGAVISDPIGPVVGDPTVQPLYKLPPPSTQYKYPNGVVSPLPYYIGAVAI
jgi:hypothetical protein